MKYNEFKVLIFNEVVASLGYEEDFEKLYNSFNFGFTDSMIKASVKKLIIENLDHKKLDVSKKQVIEFDGQAIKKLDENKNLKLEGLGFNYDNHLYKAFQLGLLTIDQLKKVSFNSVSMDELEDFDQYIYLARCTGKLMNFREQFKSNRKVIGEFDSFKAREENKTPYNKQVEGEHYISKIQPAQFIKANNLNFNQGNIVKYISRYQKKNGLKDLKKVVQYTLFEAFEEYPQEYVAFTDTIKELID